MANGDLLLVAAGAGARSLAETNRYPGGVLSPTISDAVTPQQVGLQFTKVSGALASGVSLERVCLDTGEYVDNNAYTYLGVTMRVYASGGTLYIESQNQSGGYSGSYDTYSLPAGRTGIQLVYMRCYVVASITAGGGSLFTVPSLLLLRIDRDTLAATTAAPYPEAQYSIQPITGTYSYAHLTRVYTPLVQSQVNGMGSILDYLFPNGGCNLVYAHGSASLVGAKDYSYAAKTVRLLVVTPGAPFEGYEVTVNGGTPWSGYVYVGSPDRSSGAVFYVDTSKIFSVEPGYYAASLMSPYTPRRSYLVSASTVTLPLYASDYGLSTVTFTLFLLNISSTSQSAYLRQMQALTLATLALTASTITVDGQAVGFPLVTIPAGGAVPLTIQVSPQAASSTPAVGATSTLKIGVV